MSLGSYGEGAMWNPDSGSGCPLASGPFSKGASPTCSLVLVRNQGYGLGKEDDTGWPVAWDGLGLP